MLTTIHLYGELGQKFGRKHKLAVSSPAEALRAIDANHPGLAAYLVEAGDRGVGFRVKVDGEAISEKLVNFQRPGATIRISPVVSGREKSPWVGIIAGIALVVLTWGAGAGYLGGVAASAGSAGSGVAGFVTAGGALGIQGLTYGALVGGMGISMAVGGIAQMLSPMPKGPELGGDDKPSYIFNGPVNTVEQGGPVPLAYGNVLIG